MRMIARGVIAAAIGAAGGIAPAQPPVPVDEATMAEGRAGGRWDLRGGDTVWQDGAGLTSFFYPSGYDPQYGSEGRIGDAADFAASYGCRPIWNAKTGRRMPACR